MKDPPNSTTQIADSDEDSRYLLRSLLELTGFQVLEANNGQEAIDERSVTARIKPYPVAASRLTEGNHETQ